MNAVSDNIVKGFKGYQKLIKYAENLFIKFFLWPTN